MPGGPGGFGSCALFKGMKVFPQVPKNEYYPFIAYTFDLEILKEERRKLINLEAIA